MSLPNDPPSYPFENTEGTSLFGEAIAEVPSGEEYSEGQPLIGWDQTIQEGGQSLAPLTSHSLKRGQSLAPFIRLFCQLPNTFGRGRAWGVVGGGRGGNVMRNIPSQSPHSRNRNCHI